MEESLSLLLEIKKEFDCNEVDIKTYSPLTLAYIGDAVYEMIVRTVIVERGNRAAQNLHKAATRLVNAGTQAAMVEALMDTLTEEETAIYKRGRNAKSYTSAKNATIGEYRKATGMEALVGYLYLTDHTERVLELIKLGVSKLNMKL